jgi:hypothetical protein
MAHETHLVRRCGIGEVEYLDMTLGSSDYHQRILYVHAVAAFWKLDCRHWTGCAQVPILNNNVIDLLIRVHQATETPRLTLMVLSQLPVARIPPCGASIHFTTFTGASCWATCCDWPVVTSNNRAALSAPPDNTLFPS